MSRTVKLTQSVDQREVIQAMQTLNAMMDKTARKLDQVGQRGKGAGDHLTTGLKGANRELGTGMQLADKFMGKLTQAGANLSITAVQAVAREFVANLRQAYETIKEMRGLSADRQLQVAEAQRSARGNFGKENIPLLEGAVQQIGSMGGDTVNAYDALGTAFSFKGSLTPEQAVDAVVQSQKVSGQALEPLSQAVLAQMKATGGTAEEILGFQMRLKQLTPVSSNEDFATHVAPSVSGLVRQGLTPQEAAGLVATMGQGMDDPTGRRTRTSVTRFASQIYKATNGVVPEGASFTERLQTVQNTEGIRKKLLGSFDPTGEGVDEETLRAILSGDATPAQMGISAEAAALATTVDLINGKLMQTYESFKTQSGDVEGSAPFFREFVDMLNEGKLQQFRSTHNRAESFVDSLTIGSPGSRLADAEKFYKETMALRADPITQGTLETVHKPATYMASWTPSVVDDIALKMQIMKSAAGQREQEGRLKDAEDLRKGVEYLRELGRQAQQMEGRQTIENSLPAGPVRDQALKNFDAMMQLGHQLQQNTAATKENTAVANQGPKNPNVPAAALDRGE